VLRQYEETFFLQNAICHRWTLSVAAHHSAVVLPDGCRDVIVRVAPGVAPVVFATGLDQSAYRVELYPGEILSGIRMAPGASIDERCLLSASTRDLDPEQMLCRALVAVAAPGNGIAEALSVFSSSPRSVVAAARTLGVSERTLRRTVTRATGWPPSRWLALARARRCARVLAFDTHPLAEAAASAGYSDQAHMTRDMANWFGMTPRQLRDSRSVRSLLSQPGFG
jgi:AraC-like DNA-binding protein